MILPIADALQNTLQNLVSKLAGIQNDELANRGIGMAGAMAHSIKTIAYETKENTKQNNKNNSRKEDYKRKDKENSTITNIEEQN